MEFWGIEVKPGQTVKCEAGDKSMVHLSQASLGDIKEKRSEYIPIFVRFNDQKLVIGKLSADKCTQIQYDLIFEKDFELSHGSKNTSVFFVGYKKVNEIDESKDSFDDSSSDDDLHIDEREIGIAYKNQFNKLSAEKATASKDDNAATKLKVYLEKPMKELVKADNKAGDKESGNDSNDDDDEDDDQNDSEEDSDKDEVTIESSGDSSEEDEDDSSEEETPQEKVEKKRKADSASKTPITGKKAKVVTPVENHKAGIAYKNQFNKLSAEKATASKDDNAAAKLKVYLEKPMKELVKADNKAGDKESENDSNDDDENDSEEDSDKDEETIESSGDSSEEDEDDSSEEETPQEKVEKKRKADSASKTPITGKKAKVVTPVENHKAGGDGKKACVHVATPYPAKQGGKPQPSSKSNGLLACKTCHRTFNSENPPLQSRRKSKHGNANK